MLWEKNVGEKFVGEKSFVGEQVWFGLVWSWESFAGQAGQGGSGESLHTNERTNEQTSERQQPGKYRAYPDFLLDLEKFNFEIWRLATILKLHNWFTSDGNVKLRVDKEVDFAKGWR